MSALPGPLIGWPLLTVPDAHGQLAWPSLETSVRDQIRAVLSTRPGEQLMRPGFGAGLDRLLHEPDNLATRRRIREQVLDGLSRWEARIVVDRVEVQDLPEEPGHLRVEIGYRLVRSGAPAQLAFTVSLES
jgi:phage baseplate assembly protein W